MVPAWVRNGGTSVLVAVIAGAGMAGSAEVSGLLARLHATQHALARARNSPVPAVAAPATAPPHSRPPLVITMPEPGHGAGLLADQMLPASQQSTAAATPSPSPTPSPQPSPSQPPCVVQARVLTVDACVGGTR